LDSVKTFAESNKSIKASALVKAVEQAVTQIHSQWENSPSDDAEGRERLFREISGIRMGMLRVIRSLEE